LPVKPEDAGTGYTRDLHRQAQLECKAEGKLEADAPDALKDSIIGATRGPMTGRTGRCRSGETCEPIARRDGRKQSNGATQNLKAAGSAEEIRVSGKPEIRKPARTEMRSAGQPAATLEGAAWKCEFVGRPTNPAPVAPEDGRRGNSNRIAGADLEIQEPGRPGDFSQGA